MSSPTLPPARPRSTTTIVIAVLLVLVVGLSAVGLGGLATWAFFRSEDGPARAAGPQPAYPAALARFYEQDLQWRGCGGNRCTRLTVPLDYDEPDGDTIQLAVLRSPVENQARRIGQLVVNPGGPGGSGVQYAASGSLSFGDVLTRSFDIVGFDPRGVGQSTPLKCGGTALTDALLSADPDPETTAEAEALDRVTREFGEACVSGTSDLARHMSTVEVAKDMDVLRAALGEPKLDYLGASYGTLIGATYADLFPSHVRGMVLDGAIDPSLSQKQLSLGQAAGFETALGAYLEDCVRRGCPLGDSVEAGARRIAQLLEQLDAQPLPTGSGRQLTEGLALYGVILPLYAEDYWPVLTTALRRALDGDGSRLLALADAYASRGPDGYTDNSIAALYAVNCLDHSDSIPVEKVPSEFAEFEKASPTFGRIFAYGRSTCDSWPVQSGARTKAIDAAGAPPIVVVGTTRDPATPYEQAVALAEQLESGVLVRRDGDGHTGFQQGNDCVDTAIERYLVDGTVPQDGLRC